MTEHEAICLWEDAVGDSGEAPTNLELTTFANAAAAKVLLEVAKDTRARGDVGKEDEGGITAWDYLEWKAQKLVSDD